MSATNIIDTAPLGALIRYTDGCPKPPARFTKKLAAWERSNGVGRLVKKEPPRSYPTWTAPASFTLHEGNFSSDGVILVTIMRSENGSAKVCHGSGGIILLRAE
jgi:hypothetical protein